MNSKPAGQNQQKKQDQKKSAPAASSTSTAAKVPDAIASVLGSDGKLKPEERKRRLDNNLCLGCGEAGHTVDKCTKVGKKKAKGRASTTTPASTSQPAKGDSGKA